MSHPQKVIIVCHMGVGMSQLLLAKVERRFPSVHVEATMSRAEVQDYLAAHEVDLVITTVDLPELKSPHILVSLCSRPVTSGSWSKQSGGSMSRTAGRLRSRSFEIYNSFSGLSSAGGKASRTVNRQVCANAGGQRVCRGRVYGKCAGS